jgi:GDP-L-fucose synthase
MRGFLWTIWHKQSFALETLPDYLYNVGTGEDLTIKHLARNHPKENNGTSGEIIWDEVNDAPKINGYFQNACIGWKHQVQLEE